MHPRGVVLRSLWIKIPTLALAVAAFVALDGWLAYLAAFGILGLGVALIMALVVHPNSSAWTKTLWRAPHGTNAVALTFDDGPDPRSTPAILEVLEAKGLRAAFFVVGERVRQHPELVARLHEAGHLVCNHTDSHEMLFHFRLWGPARRELRACGDAIASVIGRRPAFFRSPQGLKNPALGDVVSGEGLTAIGWQVRGLDAMGADADTIAKRITRGARPGGIIMLHDGGGFGGREDRTPTIEALPRIIDELTERGLSFRRLDELIEREPYLASR